MTTLAILKARLSLLLAIVLWSSAFAGIRASLAGGYSPGSLALLRFILASICMLLLASRLPAHRRRIPLRDKIILLLVGAFGLGCYNIALNYGEISIASGVASFIVSLSPVITLLFANLFLGERFSIGMIFGMLVSISGVGIIASGEISEVQFNIGLLQVLIATVICGLYSVLQKPFLGRYHPTEVTAWIMWGCTLLLLTYAGETLRDLHTATPAGTLSVIYLGIFPAAIGYLAWSYGLRVISATKASGYMYYMPLIASVLGWLWLDEIPGRISIAGGGVVLMGVWIVSHQHRKLVTQDEFPE